MSKLKNQLESPFQNPHPDVDRDGDKRDIHDRNPSTNLDVPHDRGSRTPANVFKEMIDEGRGRIGRVHEVSKDVVSSPMSGVRRAAAGEYEAELRDGLDKGK